MNDRFRFRAKFSVSYYDENGNDKDIELTIYDVAVYSDCEIGFSAQQIETIINALKLPEIEEDTIWQFINDNYATYSDEWFVCNNAVIEQCTGFSDKNGNLIYEGDLLGGLPVVWVNELNGFRVKVNTIHGWNWHYINEFTNREITGNIHEQP